MTYHSFIPKKFTFISHANPRTSNQTSTHAPHAGNHFAQPSMSQRRRYSNPPSAASRHPIPGFLPTEKELGRERTGGPESLANLGRGLIAAAPPAYSYQPIYSPVGQPERHRAMSFGPSGSPFTSPFAAGTLPGAADTDLQLRG